LHARGPARLLRGGACAIEHRAARIYARETRLRHHAQGVPDETPDAHACDEDVAGVARFPQPREPAPLHHPSGEDSLHPAVMRREPVEAHGARPTPAVP